MHVTRMRRDKVDRYIPGDFDRSLHVKDGCPSARPVERNLSSGRVFGITSFLGRAPSRADFELCLPHLRRRFKVRP